MATLLTKNFGIAYCDDQTQLKDVATVTQSAATTIDAALTRGGVAPPNAQDLVTLSGRVTALEAGQWVDLPLVGGSGLSHDPSAGQPHCQYRIEGKRVFTRGWAYATAAIAANAAVAGAVAAPARPGAVSVLWPTNGATTYRFEVATAGTIATLTAIPAGTYVSLHQCHWGLV